MANDQHDRLGEKLHQAEKAREDQWAAQQDRELMEKLKQKVLAALVCPHCQQALQPREEAGISLLACPAGDGAWLERNALEALKAARK